MVPVKDEARSAQLTGLLKAVKEADDRCSSGAPPEAIQHLHQAGQEFYSAIRRECDEGRTVLIHTLAGVSRCEQIRTVGTLNLDTMETTYSAIHNAPLCLAPLCLTEGDTIEVTE